jgi:hypothetical protein
MQVAMGAAQSAVAKDEMVKSVVQAYLTGGMAGITVDGKGQNPRCVY